MATPLPVVTLICVLCSVLGFTMAAQPDYCNLPSQTGPCRAAFTRYYYDTNSKSCRSFIYGGCRGNDNNFRSLAQCNSACLCSQDFDPGWQCWFTMRRYYYDSYSSQCQQFGYRGCGGNQNRFYSSTSCQNMCVTSKCYLPPDTGLCKAYFTMYYFNHTTQSCESFVYGGCQGNANRFDSIGECNRQCTNRIVTTNIGRG